MKLEPKELFLNPEYLPTHLDLRLHPQTWSNLVDHILNPQPPPSEHKISSGSSILLPIIQLCANSPSVLDVYKHEEFQLYYDADPAFPAPFDETAVAFRRVCQVPSFRKMVEESLLRAFHAFDEFVNSSFNFYEYPGLRVRLAIVKCYIHVAHGGWLSADPVMVTELNRLVGSLFFDMCQTKYKQGDETEGFYLTYLSLQRLFVNLPLPNDPTYLRDHDKPRDLALLFMSSFLEEVAVDSNVGNFSVLGWKNWFSVKFLKNLLLFRFEDIEDRISVFRCLWLGSRLLERGLFQCVPAAYDLFADADLLCVLAPFRYYPTVSSALCYYIQSVFFWLTTSLTPDERPEWCDPFLDVEPDIEVQRQYLFRNKSVIQICIILLSAPEDSRSGILGSYASPRTQIIEFLGLFWMRGEMNLTWAECRDELYTARENCFNIPRYPVYGDPLDSSVMPSVTQVDEMVAYLDSGIDLLDRYLSAQT